MKYKAGRIFYSSDSIHLDQNSANPMKRFRNGAEMQKLDLYRFVSPFPNNILRIFLKPPLHVETFS